MRRFSVAAIFIAMLLASCGRAASSPDQTTRGLRVLAAESFLADIAQNVAGDRVKVDVLLPTGVDPHAYQPAPSDVVRISESSVLIVNGAGYESFLGPLLENVEGKRQVITASEGLTSRTSPDLGEDPHLWTDPNNVIHYVENIRDGLSQADPDGTAIYSANAVAYIEQLQALDTWIREQIARIPLEKRLLVTNHESLGYFADRYGFTVIGMIVPSMSSEASLSARQLALLIDEIKASNAPAVFLDAVDQPRLADQIKAETAVNIITDLYIESLSSTAGPAPTYIAMMKHNVTRIVEGCR